MTDKQPEALRLADTLDLAPENGIEPQTSEDAAAELRRLHTENTALQQGYAAARLEIESLKSQLADRAKEHADELTVAYMCGASREKELAAQQPGAAYAALPEPHHRGPAGTGNYFNSFTADQMRAFADATYTIRASHGQAPAQAAPAAVAGPSLQRLHDLLYTAQRTTGDACVASSAAQASHEWMCFDIFPCSIPLLCHGSGVSAPQ